MAEQRPIDSAAWAKDLRVPDEGQPGEAAARPHDVTQLLRAWSDGDQQALDKLTPLVYQELYRRAHWQMARERVGNTLQTTALVNEIYVRMVDLRAVSWRDRAHFFAMSSRLIRRVLIDAARAKGSQKRGGDSPHVVLDEALVLQQPRGDLVALDEALNALAAIDPRKSQVVELRFFGGLDIAETAEVLKVSSETVKRDWKLAKAWLQRELKQDDRS